ncbi:hypothetical protein ACMX2H_18750 [Arthrobacter sulfonylureivorans]|uniref:hypothetical protein n=1 Tax=Arthrobacter sulfonylureivorans TaxID=2486855 RepID=UPI0039E4C845
MSANVPVTDWTRAWYELLPAAYRDMDAAQTNPAPPPWDGFTSDPKFLHGWGEWNTEATVADEELVEVRMHRTFTGLLSSEQVHVQAWWPDPAVEDCYVALEVKDSRGVVLAETMVDPVVEAGSATVMALPPVDGHLEVSIFVGVPAGEGNALQLAAVNIGYRSVLQEELPGRYDGPTSHPLLRWMDGPGSIAQTTRTVSDDLWAGRYTNPATAPAHALRWLAQMMGTPLSLRKRPVEELREYLTNMLASGRSATGTRQGIADAAKGFLTGDRQVSVAASKTKKHTLVLLVRADEVPGGAAGLPALAKVVQDAGVIPAGHVLVAQIATATWDDWMAAAGETWAEREAAAKTWTQADSLGVQLEETP